MLRHISSQISCGRPLWALLLMNEYLQPRDSIRKALAGRALARTNHRKEYAEIAGDLARLGSGIRLENLPAVRRRLLLDFREDPFVPPERSVPRPRSRTERTLRRKQREIQLSSGTPSSLRISRMRS